MRDQEGLVSVIIPCYNQAHFLGEAIESVLSQTYPNSEVIVIDDGSPDNTSGVAARYQNVKCIRQENQGLSAARNRGLRESKGAYIVFLDSDDRLLPGALELGICLLRGRPECTFVVGQSDIIDHDGSPLPPYLGQLVEGEDVYSALLSRCPIFGTASVMYRRSVFNAVNGFEVANSPAADFDLYYRIARELTVYSHGKAVMEYRKHDESMTRNHGLMLRANLTALHRQRGYVKKNWRYREAYRLGITYWQELYGTRLAHQIRLQVREHEWRQAARGALLLLRYYPQEAFKHAGRKLYCTLFSN